jgi:hypothetical protein
MGEQHKIRIISMAIIANGDLLSRSRTAVRHGQETCEGQKMRRTDRVDLCHRNRSSMLPRRALIPKALSPVRSRWRVARPEREELESGLRRMGW